MRVMQVWPGEGIPDRKAMFCNAGCRESFQCDRKHGLIYPPYSVDGETMGVEPASIAAGFCAYCGVHRSEAIQ